MKNCLFILLGLIFILACKNNRTEAEWNTVRENKYFDDIILFAAENIDNIYADSAISYLSDTSSQLKIAGHLVIKDSVDLKQNLIVRYSDSYGHTPAPEPPFKDRVAFRIEIDEKLNIKANNKDIYIDILEKQIVDFVLNESNLDTLPPKRIEIYKDELKVEVTVAVVELYCDLHSSLFEDKSIKEMISVMDIIFESYEKIRSLKAQELFNCEYIDLTPEEKGIIRFMNPLRLRLCIEGRPEVEDFPIPLNVSLENLIIVDDGKNNYP